MKIICPTILSLLISAILPSAILYSVEKANTFPERLVRSYAVGKNDIVINEIMADINPAPNGLPPYEYIELYNRTSLPILLHKCKIADATSAATIPDIIIQPDSFFILTSTNAAPAFGNSIQVKGVPSFPSLNDAGDNISLKDSAGNIISYVFYTNAWYNDPIKNNGGWSLEQIDVNYTCAGKANWKACANNIGGTPGRKNSVHAITEDETAPHITQCSLIDSIHIQLYFSEPADSISLSKTGNYKIDNGIGNSVMAKPIGSGYESVIITLAYPIIENIIYTIQAWNIYDCKGNSENSEIQFGRATLVEANDIIVNEIMFDPKTGGVEWIELYNRSNKIIDLKELYFCSHAINNTLSEINSISSTSYLFIPNKYIVLSTDAISIKNQYNTPNSKGFINMKNIPTLNNDSDWVVIINTSQKIIDRIHYQSAWHLPLLNETKGISLERINYDSPSQDENNWHSAAQNCGFATPAYKNSQFVNYESYNEIKITPEVFSPDNDGYQDVLAISYSFKNAGLIGSVSIYNAQGVLITSLVKNELLASTGTFFWDGYTKENTKAEIGIYVLYVEIFDAKGILKKHKQCFTLGGKL